MKAKYLLSLFLLLQIIILKLLQNFPAYIEKLYSNEIYHTLSNALRSLLGNIPFSVGDCLYGFLLILAFKWFWNQRKSWKKNWKNNLIHVFSVFSIIYFFFHILWALNYYREPLFEKMTLQKEYTEPELLLFTKQLITKTNQIQLQLTKDINSKVKFPYTQKEVFEMNLKGYKNLERNHPFFGYQNLSIKKSLFSVPLSYMGFAGYLNPFTNEAQVNSLIPLYNFPTTSCHEMAHQIGYASESECNFIGVLACVSNDDLYIQYSGYSFVLRYCLSIWKFKNKDQFQELKRLVNPGILKNYQESQDFWNKYETPLERGFEFIYDNFLKLNNQKDGMSGYSKFIDLMINYYKTKSI